MQLECLIVDDSRMVRAIAKNMVEGLGMTVSEAADGREALIQCSHKMPDLALVDWNMPVMDGLDFITAVRADEKLRGMKILLCSTEVRLGEVRKAIKTGADSYMLKPFDREKLLHRMRRFGLN